MYLTTLLHSRLYLVACLLLFAPFCQAQTKAAQIDSFFSVRYSGQINGGLLLAENDRPVYQKGFGTADFYSGRPQQPNTAFNLASISKVITSTAVLQLVERGKLQLAAPLQQYLPGFPYPAITIRHLLTHTSGLPNLELYEDLVRQHPDTIVDNRAIIPALKAWKKALPFAPGEKWQYCNTNFDLLALLVAQTSGMSYGRYLQQHIFGPAGMKESFVATSPTGVKGVTAFVWPYWYTDRYMAADSVARFRYINYNLGGLVGSTNVVSTPADLLRFDRAVFSHTLIRKETLELALTPVRLNDGSIFYEGSMDTMLGEGKGSYGMGWSIFEQPGLGKSVGHGGFNYGLATFYLHHLEPRQTLIAFDNTAGSGFGRTVTSAFRLLNGQKGIERITKKSLARIYGTVLKEQGPDEALALFHHLKTDTAHYYTSEREWNWLGYDLLRADFEGHVLLALEAFKINTLMFPDSFNVYDSYGEALVKAGKKEEAVLMYRKSLTLNPGNKGARKALEELGIRD